MARWLLRELAGDTGELQILRHRRRTTPEVSTRLDPGFASRNRCGRQRRFEAAQIDSSARSEASYHPRAGLPPDDKRLAMS